MTACMFLLFSIGGKLHFEALVSCFVEPWSRRLAWTSAVGDFTEPTKERGKGKGALLQDQSTLYDEKVPLLYFVPFP